MGPYGQFSIREHAIFHQSLQQHHQFPLIVVWFVGPQFPGREDGSMDHCSTMGGSRAPASPPVLYLSTKTPITPPRTSFLPDIRTFRWFLKNEPTKRRKAVMPSAETTDAPKGLLDRSKLDLTLSEKCELIDATQWTTAFSYEQIKQLSRFMDV
jgi:hypothetical protein